MIHPDISQLIEIVKTKGYTEVNSDMIAYLANAGASFIQTTFVIHQGFNIELEEADRIMFDHVSLFKEDEAEDPVYETFLYGNYDPKDPNFEATEDMVRFSLKKKDK